MTSVGLFAIFVPPHRFASPFSSASSVLLIGSSLFLSEGLHNESDDQCLELAKTIRIVMTALAERIETALKDESEL
jgi:hypothetical protein